MASAQVTVAGATLECGHVIPGTFGSDHVYSESLLNKLHERREAAMSLVASVRNIVRWSECKEFEDSTADKEYLDLMKF